MKVDFNEAYSSLKDEAIETFVDRVMLGETYTDIKRNVWGLEDFLDVYPEDIAMLILADADGRAEMISEWQESARKNAREWAIEDRHALIYDMCADAYEDQQQKHREE